MNIDEVAKIDQQVTQHLTAALGGLRELSDAVGGKRELSLAITQVETAMLWQAAARSGLYAIAQLTLSHRIDAEGE